MYKQGALNQAADALSRCHSHPSILALSMCSPDWVDKVKMGYEDDPAAMQILINPTRDFSVKDGLIRHQGRIWLGSNALA